LRARLIARLIEERKKAGIRQVDLAKRLKRSQTWVQRTENGKRRLEVIEFITLANAIGFDASRLIDEIQTA
jgi:transcriptional regulator with XRE-family HTH domain